MTENNITLTLPYPISANKYWRTYVPRGVGHAVTVVSSEATAYKRQVILLARAAGIREPIKGHVQVHIQLYPHRPLDWKRRQEKDPLGWEDAVRSIDLDNCRKVLYDSLKNVVFEDDKFVWSDSAERMTPDGNGGRVVVTVNKIE